MMKRLYWIATALFWVAFVSLGIAAQQAGVPAPPQAGVPAPPQAGVPAPAQTGGPVPAKPGEPAPARSAAPARYSLADVKRHARPSDCWMAIDGQVYDFTAYLPHHPAPPEAIAGSCGPDASVDYRTKNRGRPHSPYADGQMARYRIGVLESAR